MRDRCTRTGAGEQVRGEEPAIAGKVVSDLGIDLAG